MTISDLVRTYLKNKPYMLEALDNGIVNTSALARVLQLRLRIKNHQAVKASIRRYSEQRGKVKQGIEERALSVLRNNKITLLDGISVVISSRKIDLENDAEVRMDSYHVYLTRKDALSSGKKKNGESIVKLHEGCSAIIISSGAKLEGVSGVIAFLTSILAEQSVNIIELISCYTETIIVVRKIDALRCYQIISELTE